jgi:hypothetical protein
LVLRLEETGHRGPIRAGRAVSRMKRIVAWGFGLSALHLVVTLAAFSIMFNHGMADFERGELTPPTPIEKLANVLTPILMQPYMSLRTPWMNRHLPVFVEHLLFLCSSLLWGFAA